MDCQMPRMDGLEATRHVRERERKSGGARIPVIALTANVMESDRRACFDAGMDDYLGKPFTSVQLLLTLRHWLPAQVPPESHDDQPAAAASHPGERRSPAARCAPGQDTGIAAIDLAALDELRAVNPARGSRIVARAVGSFLANAPLLLERMATASAAEDGAALGAAAHALKSSAAQLGGQRLSALARDVEQHARAGALALAKPLVEAAFVEWERVRITLEPWTHPERSA
jgi:HPt (histidine-containing phosphotransfer) domain-containing protein